MSKEIKFNNRPNPNVKDELGKSHWISRSVAVNGVIMIRDPYDGLKVLVLKRSSKSADEPNKWCLPCGYLDWNESGYEAMIREVYEEAEIYIPEKINFNIYPDYNREFYVNSDPKSIRQNVSLYYMLVFDFEGIMPKGWDIIIPDGDEISIGQWIKVEDIFMNKVEPHGEPIKWAFNHDDRIKLAYYIYHNYE